MRQRDLISLIVKRAKSNIDDFSYILTKHYVFLESLIPRTLKFTMQPFLRSKRKTTHWAT